MNRLIIALGKEDYKNYQISNFFFTHKGTGALSFSNAFYNVTVKENEAPVQLLTLKTASRMSGQLTFLASLKTTFKK